ncbi:MAG: hypothetical protein LBT53_06570 [Puniceicoccales bacterium]|nr:hypothetical protein [Puniceicoccales bacterium]
MRKLPTTAPSSAKQTVKNHGIRTYVSCIVSINISRQLAKAPPLSNPENRRHTHSDATLRVLCHRTPQKCVGATKWCAVLWSAVAEGAKRSVAPADTAFADTETTTVARVFLPV